MYSHYDTPGVRITIPWHTTVPAEPKRSGQISLDFALDEKVPQRPVWVRIPRLAGGHSVMRAASPELSLAWKLLWLLRDTRAGGVSRGKDLYDAVLLAERPGTVLDAKLLRRVLAGSEGSEVEDFTLRGVDDLDLEIDWESFTRDERRAGGSVEDWMRRFVNALTIVGTG